MRTSNHASPDDIDIGTLWASLKRGLPRLFMLSALAGGATYGVLSMMAPRYTSEAQLSVVAKGSQSPFSDPKREGAAPDSVSVSVDKEAINTHVRALMSPDLARRIAEDMKLNTKKEFNSALGSLDTVGTLLRLVGLAGPRPGESEQDRVLGAYFKSLEVYSPKESRFIGIRFSSSEPALAAEIANRIAETYRSSLTSLRVVETDEVQRALEPKIVELIKDVAGAEAEVERFRGQTDRFVGGPQRTALIEQQLGELTAELTRTSGARSEVEGRAKSARELLKSGSAEVLPDVQRSPLIQNLVQQRVRAERQLAELSASLLPGHPRMQQLNADLNGLKRQINGEVSKLVEGLEKEAKAAVNREESVKKSIDTLKSKVVNTGGDDVKLRQLEAAAKSKRSELDRLQSQFEANKARATPGAVPVEAQIITQARASSVPTFPRKGPYSALVAVAALLFGTAWVISKSLFVGARSNSGSDPMPNSGSFSRSGRAEPALAVATRDVGRAAASSVTATAAPLQAAASRSSQDKYASDVTWTSKGSPEAGDQLPAAMPKTASPASDGSARTDKVASMAELASRIIVNAPAQGGYRVLIAGETAAIEASAEAIELAKCLSKAGKQVILVDWALDGESMTERLGVQRVPGLTDLLQGGARFEDVIRREPTCNVHVLAAGAAIDVIDAGVDDDQLNLVLDALDEAYDTIVVVGTNQAARRLFEAIQGRFDAGVIVVDGKKKPGVLQDPPGTLLGFEVTDIDVVRFERQAPQVSGIQRIMRTGTSSGVELRPS
ncbi:MAG: lipopolysaccharide biosynthesis protein [Hyphomicrobium sp.]|nr:lipopolysaccharide biosynthesis protein [Hyphomicrobium sp.]PPC84196.1 MAG: lipopolysaccharide biosynthesis protein [Hyphomicrobium sp.]